MRVKILIFLGLLLIGCEKSEDRSCVKSIGNQTSKEILLDHFNMLFMGPHIKYKLIQGAENKIVINGGENVINDVEVRIENQKLIIENKSKCNFLRPYDEIVEVEIHFVELVNVEFEGTNEVICSDTIQTTDLTLLIRDGAGMFDLKLNANSLSVSISHGWGNYKVSGNVNYAKFQIASNGYGNAYGLNVANELITISSTTGLVEVNANQCALLAEINNSGSIHYKGNPSTIQFNNYGTGQLIDKN